MDDYPGGWIVSEPDQIDMMDEEQLKREVGSLVIENIRLRQQLDQLQSDLARALAELEQARQWNHSVRVCKEHTSQIIGLGCAVCDLARAREQIAHIRELVSIAHLTPYQRVRDIQDVLAQPTTQGERG
jgi:hypothetical protein